MYCVSKTPFLHSILISIPNSYLPWQEILDSNPSIRHLIYWLPLFMLLPIIAQFISHLISRVLISILKLEFRSKADIKKLEEVIFSIAFKTANISYAIYIVHNEKWATDPQFLFEGWPKNVKCEYDLKLIYNLHFGWYAYRTIAQLVYNRHLKDFIPTVIHHFATLILISMSYTSYWLRIGVLILIVHDPGDITLQAAKFWRILGVEFMCNFFFGSLVFVWVFTRLLLFPYACIYPCVMVMPLLCSVDWSTTEDVSKHWMFSVEFHNTYCIAWIPLSLLFVLWALHAYWFRLLIKAVKRVWRGRPVDDPREKDVVSSADEAEKMM